MSLAVEFDEIFDIFLEKAQVEEERAKASEEKFQKLKNMYTQIRDEHIKLLRQVRLTQLVAISKLIKNFQSKIKSERYLKHFNAFIA